jgi:oligosaccharide reducing-end xylanase
MFISESKKMKFWRNCFALPVLILASCFGCISFAQVSSGSGASGAHVNAPLGVIPSMPGDGDGAFRSKRYRNLFAENGNTPAEIQSQDRQGLPATISRRCAFGRACSTSRAGSNANGPLAYITDWANNDARTEGMSYGMMIAVQLDKKREFDALWNWANTYMLITDPKNPSVGYFAWSMGTDGTPRSTGRGAGRRRVLHAMALYFAAHRWGNGAGPLQLPGTRPTRYCAACDTIR